MDEITLPAKGETVKVQFKALSDKDNVGCRYGLVAVDNKNHATYLGSNSSPKATLKYTNPGDMKKLYLVVVGCPTKEYKPETGWGRDDEETVTYPYQIKF